MIPVKLIIEGIYSYQERQTIDFSDLTNAGLFGIFGAVGSGKSSILEAISYALYGETERLNARDKRTYNMMNLKSNRSYIEFDFYNFENKLFRATREFKRNSKNFEDVKAPSVVFYEYKNEAWIPLEHADSEKIIGLSYTNFKRTIIIPQGQFKEFLELGETDRTRMMKEIFGLEKFDLQDKVLTLNRKNQSNLDQLDGQLKGFTTVSQEEIDLIQQQLEQVQSIYTALSLTSQKENEIFQQLKNIKIDVEILEQKKNEEQQLADEKIEIDLRKTKVDAYEKIYLGFHSLLTEQKRLQTELQTKKKDISTQQITQHTIDAQLLAIDQELIVWQSKFDVLPVKRQEEHDWSLVIQNIEALEQKKVLKERMQKGEEEVQKVKDSLLRIENAIKINEEELQELSQQKTDTALLMQIDQWFAKQVHLKQALTAQEQKVVSPQEELEKLSEMAKLTQVNLQTFDVEYAQFYIQFEAKKQQVETQKNHLMVQQQMAQYVHELHDGKPCPLCGALEHPEIVASQDVSKGLEKIQEELTKNEQQFAQWQEKRQQVQRLRDREKIFATQLQLETNQLHVLNDELSKHDTQFVWEAFDRENPEAFQQVKQASLQREQQIKQVTEKVAVLRKDWNQEHSNFEKYRIVLEDFKNQEIVFDSKMQQNESLLKFLSWTEVASLTTSQAQLHLEELKTLNDQTEVQYQKLTDQKNQFVSQKTSLLATIEILQQQAIQLQKDLEQQEMALTSALVKHKIEQISDVLNVLNQQIDVVKERQVIENFSVRYQTLIKQIQELETKLSAVAWSLEKFEKQQQIVLEVTEQLKQATENRATLDAEKQRLTKAFEEKRELLEKQTSLQNRADNLKTMKKLFDKAGFVQYVSAIYLRQLCDHANVRFHRMTRNQLSLQLNDKGDFEIIDYLNEGRSRSVKTLSGGQGFQASLSLALALAESVQANAQADKNFFFIDEGFGTQDPDSVNIVFETLMSLQKENRIVGIISHVEELKDRISKALSITKDEERGSLIEVVD
ncbi:MAG TPA: SMC family ATPase [Flavobacterium sp.]|nr:SMC family ATPase [Flavobacterium sp.]